MAKGCRMKVILYSLLWGPQSIHSSLDFFFLGFDKCISCPLPRGTLWVVCYFDFFNYLVLVNWFFGVITGGHRWISSNLLKIFFHSRSLPPSILGIVWSEVLLIVWLSYRLKISAILWNKRWSSLRVWLEASKWQMILHLSRLTTMTSRSFSGGLQDLLIKVQGWCFKVCNLLEHCVTDEVVTTY